MCKCRSDSPRNYVDWLAYVGVILFSLCLPFLPFFLPG